MLRKVSLPGNITADGAATLSRAVGGDGGAVSVSLELKKKIFGSFEKLPCVSNVGSCDYDDVCSMLKPVPAAECPLPQGCACPFAAGDYALPAPYSTYVELPASVPSWLSSGSYKAHIQASDDTGAVACLDLEIELASKELDELAVRAVP